MRAERIYWVVYNKGVPVENKSGNILTGLKKQSTGIMFLSSNALKIIACICMLTDHVGLVFMENKWYMRAVGRLAFPIFAFLIVQGSVHTSNVRKYILRLAVFALISEIPFDLAIHDSLLYPGAQNVFFTLAAGLIAIYALESRGTLGGWGVEIALAVALVSEFLRFDYGMAGIGIIIMFYWSEKKKRTETPVGPGATGNLALKFESVRPYTEDPYKRQTYLGLRENVEMVIISALTYIFCLGMRQLYALLALIPINMYNGKRGKWNLKYVFYLFYPVHLFIIWLIWKK